MNEIFIIDIYLENWFISEKLVLFYEQFFHILAI